VSKAWRAATPAPAALDITLPYRELGVIPFSSMQTFNPNVSCNSNDNPTAFIVDHINGHVTRFNICTAETLATINVTSRPLQVRVTPDGGQAIVTSYDHGITFIDTSTNQITGVLQPDILASGLAISSDGSYALVTNYDDVAPYLTIVDIATQSVLGNIPLDREYPQSVFLNPDNTLAWVTYPWVNAVEVIDILTEPDWDSGLYCQRGRDGPGDRHRDVSDHGICAGRFGHLRSAGLAGRPSDYRQQLFGQLGHIIRCEIRAIQRDDAQRSFSPRHRIRADSLI
jgi:DNA-binding beta-propeller fold protein YncE